MQTKNDFFSDYVAIIGIACRFPGSNNPDTYWENLRDGVFSVSHFSDEELIAAGIDAQTLRETNYVKANGIVENAETFDASFFGFNANDATMMDPQQRFFLECAWEAIENAGYNVEKLQGSVGVYAGTGMNTYLIRNLVPHLGPLEALEQFRLMIASDKDYIATRVSFKFNLTGPSVNVQTSCSTSIVALHLASQSLLSGESDMALAGGVAIRPALVTGYAYREGMIYSPDGHCRAFDARAGGTVNGNGIGVVLLKRLSDALEAGDYIHAVVRGTAINNDGASKRSYTAPSSDGQAQVIAKAIERAGIRADDISYVEAHGTGTILGDPIEIDGLTQAFNKTTERRNFCAIGSVKTNIGHTDVAAGMAGLLKVVQMLKHKQIAPSLHFETPNPHIDFNQTPFFVNTALKPWTTEQTPRRAGISSFGVGGTNAHAIIEEAPERPASGASRAHQLFVVSARTETALDHAISNIEEYLNTHPDMNMADMSYTLKIGRKEFDHRAIAIRQADKQDDWLWLRNQVNAQGVIFMFSGQGSQYVNMARDLYESEAAFRDCVDTCADYLQPILEQDIRTLLYPLPGNETVATEQITQTAMAQVLLFTVEYALSQLWMSWGIQPKTMVGHSIGEYVAACLAGVMSLKDALKIVAERGRLMQMQPRGAMLAIALSEPEVTAILQTSEQRYDISLINTVDACVVSSTIEAISQLEADFKARDVDCRILQTSHAFHSFMMDEAVQPFVDFLTTIPLKAPQIPYLSNVTGTWITSEEATDPAYYGKHMRQMVRFAHNIGELAKLEDHVLLEVGPGQTLASLARRHPAMISRQIFSSTRHPNAQRDDQAFILSTLGQLWASGITVDWTSFYQDEKRLRVPMPSYPFERQRYWIDEPTTANTTKQVDFAMLQQQQATINSTASPRASHQQTTDSPEAFMLNIWRETLGVPTIDIKDNFFDLGGDSLVAARLLAQIDRITGIRIPLVQFFQSPNPAGTLKLLQARNWQWQASPINLVNNANGITGMTNGENSAVDATLTFKEDSTLSMIKIIEGHPDRRPFFWTHGTDFANFARLMDQEQPYYVMPPPGLDGKHPIYTQAEDIVAYHIEQMKLVQASGPYIIGGYCLGGHLALNIAEELLRRKEVVELVVLVDVLPPDFDMIDERRKRNHIKKFIHHLQHGQLPSRILWKVQEYFNRYKTNLVGEEELRLLQQLDDIQQKAFEFHIPEAYPGPVVAFTCSVYDARKPADSDARWARLVPGGIAHYVIPGDHNTLMREPNVDLLIETLNTILKEATTQTRTEAMTTTII